MKHYIKILIGIILITFFASFASASDDGNLSLKDSNNNAETFFTQDETMTMSSKVIDADSDVNWVKFKLYDPEKVLTSYILFRPGEDNFYTRSKQLDLLGDWVFVSVTASDTAGNTIIESLNQDFYVSPEGRPRGGQPGEKTMVVDTREEQILNVTCGNGVCDKNEGPWNCPKDCPINFDVIVSGELFGQYWFVQLLMIFIMGWFLYIFFLPKDNKKRRKGP